MKTVLILGAGLVSRPIVRYLLAETDCPFLAPQGHRGRRNEPAFVKEVLACVADARGDDPGALAATTSANAERLFELR